MKLFIIKKPYVNYWSVYEKSLKSYNTNLEVFECDCESGEKYGSGKLYSVEKLRNGDSYLLKLVIVIKYNYLKGGWIKDGWAKKPNTFTVSNIFETLDAGLANQSTYNVCFTTLEIAKVAKLILCKAISIDCLKEIDRIKSLIDKSTKDIEINHYLKKINRLKSLQELNDSDIEKPFKEIKEEFPEYFI
jgi:hypothetical protein